MHRPKTCGAYPDILEVGVVVVITFSGFALRSNNVHEHQTSVHGEGGGDAGLSTANVAAVSDFSFIPHSLSLCRQNKQTYIIFDILWVVTDFAG